MGIKAMKAQYNKNKTAKVGELIKCPSCGTEFEKPYYNSIFCNTKGKTICKDYYWNNVTPSKRNNTTRISPANRKFQEDRKTQMEYDDGLDFLLDCGDR